MRYCQPVCRPLLAANLISPGETELLLPLFAQLPDTCRGLVYAGSKVRSLVRSRLGWKLSPNSHGGREKFRKDLGGCRVLFTGLHCVTQWETAQAARAQYAGSLTIIGHAELTAVGDTKFLSKPGDCFYRTLLCCDYLLVPTESEPAFQEVLAVIQGRKCLDGFATLPRVTSVPKILSVGSALPDSEFFDPATQTLRQSAASYSASTSPVPFIQQTHASADCEYIRNAISKAGGNPTLLARPGVHDTPKHWDVVHDLELKLALLHAAPVVVTEHSYLGYACALAGKRVVYYLPDARIPGLPVPEELTARLRQGAALRARSPEELAVHVKAAIHDAWSVGPLDLAEPNNTTPLLDPLTGLGAV